MDASELTIQPASIETWGSGTHHIQKTQPHDHGSPSQTEDSTASLEEEIALIKNERKWEEAVSSSSSDPANLDGSPVFPDGTNTDTVKTSASKIHKSQSPRLEYAIETVFELDHQTSGRPAPSHRAMIEVLMRKPPVKPAQGKVSRKLASNPVRSTAGVMEPVSEPIMIRIRSRFLMDLLQDITHTSLEYIEGDPERNGYYSVDSDSITHHRSFVFLHPFKLFIRYEAEIRKCEKALAAKFRMGEDNESDQTAQEAIEASESPKTIQSISEPMHKRPEGKNLGNSEESPLFKSRIAYLQLNLLITLFDNHLSSLFAIRHNLNKGESTTIIFENLWLLFDVGELVFMRNPGGEGFEQLPRLSRVTHFTGGRLDPHDKTEISPEYHESLHRTRHGGTRVHHLGKFYINSYMLESDGRNFGPEQTEWTIPSWDGERAIRDLECFPVRFCRPGIDFPCESLDAWKHELVQGGKDFSRLTPGSLREYHGSGVDEHFTEQTYHSQVIIDIGMARREVPGLLPGRIEKGITLREGTSVEIVSLAMIATKDMPIPELIHDDIAMDYDLALASRDTLGPSSTRFKNPDELQNNEEDYALFPRQVSGFALNYHKWVNMNVDKLQCRKHDSQLWDRLQLPVGYKDALLSLLEVHVRPEGFMQPNFDLVDLVKDKGTGTVVLLHGPPGVGKTSTAEAIALYTGRGLYSFTCGDLGEGTTNINQNLANILYRGYKWGCVILLDEADVFFLDRANDSIERNRVISVFLQQIEYYPGILFLTTNRTKEIDRAIASRVTLSLFYPPLNREATGKIWQSCLKDIQRFVPGASAGEISVLVTKSTRKWWKDKYDEAIKNERAWWSGRQIQNSFRRAVALAMYSERQSQRQMHGPSGDQPQDAKIVRLNCKHFEAVDSLHRSFQEQLGDMLLPGHAIMPAKDEGPDDDDSEDYETP